MEFTEYKCPVCDKQFKKGDDVVVCPECGAPHHRECYEKKVIVILQTNTVLIFLLKKNSLKRPNNRQSRTLKTV